MGFSCFTKILRYASVAAVAAAAVFVAIVALSLPTSATSHNDGGGGVVSLKSWDTDNLRYGRYNAQSFNIPFHDYSGYSGVEACQKNVADGFFQSGSRDVVSTVVKEDKLTPEDFPVFVFSGGSWGVEAETSTDNDSGCDSFVSQQKEMVSQIAGNGGYYLDASGSLHRLSGNSVLARFSGRSFSYGSWTNKGSDDFAVRGAGAVRNTSRYLDRVDGYGKAHAIYPVGTSLSVPETTTNGKFGSNLHGTVSGGFVRVAVPDDGVGAVDYLPYGSGLCPSGFHPRGEDSYQRIGGSTGRTLGGLSHSVGKTADKYWCRSDVRYLRSFKAEHHSSLGDNITRRSDAVSAGSIFTAYGRLNCYYTSTSVTTLSNGGYVCGYYFPVPQCDPDTDNNSNTDWRDYTEEELEDIADDLGAGKFNKDEGEACPPVASTPPGSTPGPNTASFSGTACVTATLSIYENRVVGSDAEPGIVSSDRTLAVADSRTAWDLDVTSAHPATASPPRETGDASGCADGSEERAGHSSSPAGAARKQSPAPAYAASGRTNTAVPPNDADGDIDYSGAVKNMAHRYAGRIAENACAAKRAEAEFVLSEMKARRFEFQRYIDTYESRLDSAIGVFGGYSANIQTGSSTGANSLGLKVRQYNATHQKPTPIRVTAA